MSRPPTDPQWCEFPPDDAAATPHVAVQVHVDRLTLSALQEIRLSATSQEGSIHLTFAVECAVCWTLWVGFRHVEDIVVGVSPSNRCDRCEEAGPDRQSLLSAYPVPGARTEGGIAEAAQRYVAEGINDSLWATAAKARLDTDPFDAVANQLDVPDNAIRSAITHGVSAVLNTFGVPPGLSHAAGKIVSYMCKPPVVGSLHRAATVFRVGGVGACVVNGGPLAESASAIRLAKERTQRTIEASMRRSPGRPTNPDLDYPAPPKTPGSRPATNPRPARLGPGEMTGRATV